MSLKQLSLFSDEIAQSENHEAYSEREIGTFKDSMRAPIYRWFRYPAGYSYKFVEYNIDKFNIHPGQWIYDPFSGTGTTLVTAKRRNINAIGVEAHSFVNWVASVKLYWEFDYSELGRQIHRTLSLLSTHVQQNIDTAGVFPELVYKCYHPNDLNVLFLIREYILSESLEPHFRNLLKLALTDTLRGAAAAGTGWPYIAPKKDANPQIKNAFAVFKKTLLSMYADLETIADHGSSPSICNILGDSRERQDIQDGQISLALTSPPYLNNYDYADRTRLETYFWGIASSWADITRLYRDKLMVAATTQVIRREHQVETALNKDIREIDPEVYERLQESIQALAVQRTQKGGKKDYDLMTALYFNDIVHVLRETYRVLDTGGQFCLVLGDSAPYGVHIPTETFIGKLGVGIGFYDYSYFELRERGNKWKENPQRHKVPLREGVVVLHK